MHFPLVTESIQLNGIISCDINHNSINNTTTTGITDVALVNKAHGITVPNRIVFDA